MERVYIKYDPKTNLPTHEAVITNQRDKEVKTLSRAVCVTNKANQNLTTSQKEIIRWHFRLGHIELQHIQWLIITGRLKVQVNHKSLANREMPRCTDCDFVKGNSRTNKVNRIKNNPMKEQDIKKDHLLPGHMVSSDNYIPRDPVRIYHTKGKSDPSDMCSGGCILLTTPVVM